MRKKFKTAIIHSPYENCLVYDAKGYDNEDQLFSELNILNIIKHNAEAKYYPEKVIYLYTKLIEILLNFPRFENKRLFEKSKIEIRVLYNLVGNISYNKYKNKKTFINIIKYLKPHLQKAIDRRTVERNNIITAINNVKDWSDNDWYEKNKNRCILEYITDKDIHQLRKMIENNIKF